MLAVGAVGLRSRSWKTEISPIFQSVRVIAALRIFCRCSSWVASLTHCSPQLAVDSPYSVMKIGFAEAPFSFIRLRRTLIRPNGPAALPSSGECPYQ